MHPVLRPAIAQAFPDSAVDDAEAPSPLASARRATAFPPRGAAPFGLAIAVATSLLAACGGGHNDNETTACPRSSS